MIKTIHSSTRRPGAASRLGWAGLALAMACLGKAQAYSFNVPATAANLTNIAVDGKCNLTEAIQSVLNGPVNADCVPYGGTDRTVFISGANTVFQVAANTTIWGDMQIYTSFSGQVIEAAGTPLKTIDGCLLTLTATSIGNPLTIRVKSGSTGRALYAGGDIVASNIIFQGGNVTGLSGDTFGGVIRSWEGLTLTDCTIQGGTAVQGGGLYLWHGADLYHVTIQNNTATDAGGGIFTSHFDWSAQFQYCTIQNNTATKRGGGIYSSGQVYLFDSSVKGNKAGQGGGIFHQWKDHSTEDQHQPNLNIERSTLSDNKAIATEVTPIPGPSGTVVTGTGTQCSATETPSQAFDDNFGTKYCTNVNPDPNNAVTLTYDFPGTSTQTVTAYSITTANDSPTRDPADWTFEGWNGTSWVVLHTVHNWRFFRYPDTGASAPQRFFTESFNTEAFDPFTPVPPSAPWQWRIANTAAYQAYRLKITRNAGFYNGPASNITQLAELQLYLDGRTGDGGGLYSISRMFLTNSTISGNIAGCVNASCACAGTWCSTPSNTSPAMGKGGGLYAGNPAPESFIKYMTVVGNSASQGGGVYQDQLDHWEWSWSLFAHNNARAVNAPERDFHGDPHTGLQPRGSCIFQYTPGINIFPGDDPNSDFARGLQLGGPEPDYVADPLINGLADNGGSFGVPHTFTHALQSGSPARDKAKTAIANSPPTTDQRGSGFNRWNGTFPDLGSYEF
ncbi:MAG: Periplasmic protein TonB links inner and outer rane-like [Fibrobacteres bacterium]|nr:Periplasmic protein TonB links inner and outer rane-like [Fibrobacterota bacterium]